MAGHTFGRYWHPQDANPAPIDPSFNGYGVLTTEADGRYAFRTVKPGAYPIGAGRFRTPHIHFCITSSSTRLITQMYFHGEPLNDKDIILPYTENKEDLIVKLQPAPDAGPDVLVAKWDIVLWQS